MSRPRLTDKVAAGLAWVVEQAGADLESTMADEIPSLTKDEADRAAAALVYLKRLYVWHFSRAEPPIDEQDRDNFEAGLP